MFPLKWMMSVNLSNAFFTEENTLEHKNTENVGIHWYKVLVSYHIISKCSISCLFGYKTMKSLMTSTNETFIYKYIFGNLGSWFRTRKKDILKRGKRVTLLPFKHPPGPPHMCAGLFLVIHLPSWTYSYVIDNHNWIKSTILFVTDQT